MLLADDGGTEINDQEFQGCGCCGNLNSNCMTHAELWTTPNTDQIGDVYLLCAMRQSYSYSENLILASLDFHAFKFSTLPQYCLLH